MFGLPGFVPEVQNGPGEKHGNQNNNRAAKQQNEQIAKFSPGLALDLARAQESKHREGQPSESRLGQQMRDQRPGDRKPPQQEYPRCKTHINLFRLAKYATNALSSGSDVSSRQ